MVSGGRSSGGDSGGRQGRCGAPSPGAWEGDDDVVSEQAPEGDPPPGKVWSVEHGHWHDINPPNGSVDGH